MVYAILLVVLVVLAIHHSKKLMEELVHITARAMEAVKFIFKPMVYTVELQKVPVSQKVLEVNVLVPQDFVKNAYPNAKDRVLELLMRKFEELSANYLFVFMKNEL